MRTGKVGSAFLLIFSLSSLGLGVKLAGNSISMIMEGDIYAISKGVP